MTTQQTAIPGEVTRLADELRRLREQAGLSFTALGEQTPFSRSAWQRYLTAQVLPPWQAVRDLCRLAGEPEPRLRAMWELAESASRGRDAVMADPAEPGGEPASAPGLAPEEDPEIASSPRSRPRISRPLLATTLIAMIAAAAVGVYLLRPADSANSTSKKSTTGRFTVSCTSGSCDPTCRATACNGQDPQLTLCGVQAHHLRLQQTPSGAGLEILYNSRCQAAWASFWNTKVGDTLTVTVPGQPTQTVGIADPRYTAAFTYTPMISVAGSSAEVRACITHVTGTPDCYNANANANADTDTDTS